MGCLRAPYFIMLYELNKTYHKKFEDVKFDNLDEVSLLKAFLNGSTISRFIELWLARNYDKLMDSDTVEYDLWDFEKKRKVEVKSFTKGGCNFMPSYMIGAGRKLEEEKAYEYIDGKIFCIVDIIDYPNIYYKFIEGDVLQWDYPKYKIPIKQRTTFFKRSLAYLPS